jgi:hypothetical protein
MIACYNTISQPHDKKERAPAGYLLRLTYVQHVMLLPSYHLQNRKHYTERKSLVANIVCCGHLSPRTIRQESGHLSPTRSPRIPNFRTGHVPQRKNRMRFTTRAQRLLYGLLENLHPAGLADIAKSHSSCCPTSFGNGIHWQPLSSHSVSLRC